MGAGSARAAAVSAIGRHLCQLAEDSLAYGESEFCRACAQRASGMATGESQHVAERYSGAGRGGVPWRFERAPEH